MNRLSSSTDSLGRSESYLYDLNGNLVRKVKRDGATIEYTYDPANQLIEKRVSNGEVARYSYDLLDNVTSAIDDDSAVFFERDLLGRVTRTYTTLPVASSIEYAYDAVGNRLSLKDPQGNLAIYQYDDKNRLTRLTSPAAELFGFQYDFLGRRVKLTYPNGIVTSYSYDPASRLLSVHYDQGSTPVAYLDYAYDDVGNRVQKTEIEGVTNYSYDMANRLVGASTTGGLGVNAIHDPK